MLTCAIFNPLFGNIYQLYDTKCTFLISIVIFEAGSTLCGAAPTSAALIVGRAISGVGAAGIRPRPMYTSFFGMAFGVSSVLGPFLGGTFTDHVSWRWVFYINLPLGSCIFAAVLFFLVLPSVPKEKLSLFTQAKRLDPIGLLFFVPSMVFLLLALQWGGATNPWSAPKVTGLLVTFAITFVAFLVVEFKMADTAMAPARVVLNRSVAGAMLFTFLIAGGMTNAVYYISIWFQVAQAQSAMQADVRTIAMVLPLVLFGVVTAAFMQKTGYYVPAMLVSPVVSATACGLLSTLTPHSGAGKWIGYQVLYGVGTGTVLERKDVPLGMGLMFFMRQLGGAVFLSVGQNIFSAELVGRLSGIAGATDLRNIVPAAEVDSVVEAYSYSLTRVFILASALSSCMLVGPLMVEWRSIKKSSGPAPTKSAIDA
ncbi:MFS general substrate transporter [Decorospora gaudefroyi]|uniref:MFS general substrate transporter n=1 Tax=Decorospora gaudefroyi TaxID=184978 RepID=A0A6A5K9X1_9PLEO|nr:MFS general substrate transporter [Decorospora gaudefroyi]